VAQLAFGPDTAVVQVNQLAANAQAEAGAAFLARGRSVDL
jgi:hypothetical protein